MKTMWIRICLLWIFSGYAVCNRALSQLPELKGLKLLPNIIQCDTAFISIQYMNGIQANIQRLSYWDSLLTVASTCNYPLYKCRIAGTIAGIYSTNNDMPRAVAYALHALTIAETHAYKAEMIPLLKRLERLASLRLDRKQSLYFIYKGLKVAEELGDKRAMADFYSFLGLYYYTSGEIDKALKIHFQCLDICRSIGYDFGISSALVDIGTAYSFTGEFKKAIPYYLESKKYLAGLAGTVYAVQIYNSISAAYDMQGIHDSAYYYSNKALKLAESIGNKMGIASALEIMANTDLHAGNNKAARQHALKALDLARSTHFIAQLPSLLSLLKQIYLKEGNYKEALKMYEFYVSTNDSFSGERVKKQAIEKEFAYQLEKKENAYTLLAQRSQIQDLMLIQQRYLVGTLGGLLLIILTIVYLVMRHRKFRSEHQRVQLEQKLLRMQMNPHFLFNSMNSIQQLIMSGKNQPAELYLSKFSKLIRDLLESNTRECLTVQEETDMLQAYLEMESLRFGNNFSYAIHVDKQINSGLTNIPHLMIQPFVENAIWHGLLAKNGDRRLLVSIEYDAARTIKCTVDDNGIGRAECMKTAHVPPRKSLALDLVKQRIDLIRKTYKISGSVSIVDKKDAENRSLGTTVVLILPILNQ